MTWLVRPNAVLAPLTVALIAALTVPTGLGTSIAAAQDRPAQDRPSIEGDASFFVSFFKGFLDSCSKAVHGDPDLGKIACSCAAAVVADRFTTEDLSRMQREKLNDFDKVHPGTSKLVASCGQAAKASLGK